MTEEQSDVHSDNSLSDSSTVLLSEEAERGAMRRAVRVAVIGAGPAGLCAARHLATAQGLLPTVFERSSTIGGTWVYSDSVGKDQWGLPVHSNLYKDLRTNLPKECMCFPELSYRADLEDSYVDSATVLQYLNDYADQFNIRPLIKFNYHVKRVAPMGKGWSITAEDLPNKTEEVYSFDAVMVCSGPHSIPVYPQLDGMAKYSGIQMHSREFRTVDIFDGKRVLAIGLGPSGMDIALLASKIAKKVFLSHNKEKLRGEGSFPDAVTLKPNVQSFKDKLVYFTDETVEEVDAVIYCTGYTHHFPFLSKDCGIVVDQYVSPLYKHFINIENPTMCIIGLPKYCPHLLMIDYQVRFFVNTLLGKVTLPTREEMMADLENDIQIRKLEKQRKKDYHKMWKDRSQYFRDLSDLGNLEPLAPVHIQMFSDAFLRALRNYQHFRESKYRIIDDEHFEVINGVSNTTVN